MKTLTFEEAKKELKNKLTDFLVENNIKSNKYKTMFNCINPNHNDHSPSMHVFESFNGEQIAYCLGCNMVADVFMANNLLHSKPLMGHDFILENMKPLADHYGIDFEMKPLTVEEVEEMNMRSLYKIVRDMIVYRLKHMKLTDNNVTKYLEERQLVGITSEYDIGYVADWDNFKLELISRGISEEMLAKSDITERIFNPNNIIFSISDENSGVRGFAARNCNYNEEDRIGSKYINTSNNVLYSKRGLLYNLHRATKRKTGKYNSLYVTEGYTDAIALDKIGLKAVAIGSTKFTEDHIALLQRMAETDIVLILDGDDAGIKNTARTITEVMEGIRNFRTRIITLPDELDPDEFVRERGREALLDLPHITAFEWRLVHLQMQTDLDAHELAASVIPLIVNESSELQRDKMCKQLFEITNIPLDTIRAEARKLADDDKLRVQSETETVVDNIVKSLRKNPTEAQLILADGLSGLRNISDKYQSDKYNTSEYLNDLNNIKLRQEFSSEEDCLKINRLPRWEQMIEGNTAGKLFLLGGNPGAGKCIHKDVLIMTATGSLETIETVVNKKLDVMTFDEENYKIVPTKVAQYYNNGIKKTYKVITQSKREVITTDNHPFLTPNGWVELKDLTEGSLIGVPKSYDTSYIQDNPVIQDYQIKMLAYFMTEGGLTSPSYKFTNIDDVIVREFLDTTILFGDSITTQADGITYAVKKSGSFQGKPGPSNAKAYYNSICGKGELSKNKKVPPIINECSNRQVALFLNRAFSCDGSIYRHSGSWNIEYATSSIDMARNISHLLLRFGIFTSINKKIIKKKFTAYRVTIHAMDLIEKFINEIGFYGAKTTIATQCMLEIKTRTNRTATRLGIDPNIPRYYILEHIVKTGRKNRAWWKQMDIHNVKRAINRGDMISPRIVKNIANIIGSDELLKIANSDIIFEPIKSIEYYEDAQTYDLTIDKTHNFIANDILVHNTSYIINVICGILQSMNGNLHWDQPSTTERFNNVSIIYHTVDDSREEVIPRFLAYLGATKHPEVTINAMAAPDRYKLKDKEGLLQVRNEAYAQMIQWASDGRLIIKDASVGATLTAAQNIIRNVKQKYPDRHIIYICDNLYNLADFPNLEDTAKIKEITRVLKQEILVSERVMGLCTVEYRKGGENVKSRQAMNELIKESKSLEYQANWIGHLYNELYTDPDDTKMYFWDPNLPIDMCNKDNRKPIVRLIVGKTKLNDVKGDAFYYFMDHKATFLEINAKDVAAMDGDVKNILSKHYYIPNNITPSKALDILPKIGNYDELFSVA